MDQLLYLQFKVQCNQIRPIFSSIPPIIRPTAAYSTTYGPTAA